jgi:hypothetical protein
MRPADLILCKEHPVDSSADRKSSTKKTPYYLWREYVGVSKIFRTDAVKIIKLTIRPIGHHHARSSSLPHKGTGGTVSSIFGTLPGSPFLSVCQALSAIRPGSPKWYQTGVLAASVSFMEIGTSHRVPNQGGTVGGDDSHFVCRQKLQGKNGSVRRGVVMVKQPGMFSQKLGRRLRTFSRSRRKMSQLNPEFTVWPVGTSASGYHNGCIDGGTSP